MNYAAQQKHVQSQYRRDIGFAMLRVLLIFIATGSFSCLALSFLFQHELSPVFSSVYLFIIVAIVGAVFHAFSRYDYDAKQANSRLERSLRMLQYAVDKQSNS